MVFNQASKKLLESAGRVRVVGHDWWTYQYVFAGASSPTESHFTMISDLSHHQTGASDS